MGSLQRRSKRTNTRVQGMNILCSGSPSETYLTYSRISATGNQSLWLIESAFWRLTQRDLDGAWILSRAVFDSIAAKAVVHRAGIVQNTHRDRILINKIFVSMA